MPPHPFGCGGLCWREKRDFERAKTRYHRYCGKNDNGEAENLNMLRLLPTVLSKPHFTATKKGCRSILLLVRETGLEPVRCKPHAPQTCASASSATLAFLSCDLAAQRLILYHFFHKCQYLFAKKIIFFAFFILWEKEAFECKVKRVPSKPPLSDGNRAGCFPQMHKMPRCGHDV